MLELGKGYNPEVLAVVRQPPAHLAVFVSVTSNDVSNVRY